MLKRLGFLIASLASVLAASLALANVVGSDAQNFNPTTSGLDFVTVQSSETLEPGVFNFGFFVNYAKNPLPVYDATGSRSKRESSLIGGDVNLGYGFGRNWDLGISLPLILDQNVTSPTEVGHYSSRGNTEVRVNSKYRLLGSEHGGIALVGSVNFNRITDNPYLGEKGGPIYNLELAMDTTAGNFALGLNLGRRWRNRGPAITGSGIEPLADQWLASVATSYLFDRIDTKIIIEALAALPESNQLQSATNQEYTVAEALVGLKYDYSPTMAIHAGAGASLSNGISSPDYRVYTGLNVAFGSGTKQKSVAVDPYAEPIANRRRTRPTPRANPAVSAEIDEMQAQAATDEIAPAQGSETVNNVNVFNRGSFKHIVLQNLEFQQETVTLSPDSAAYLRSELIPALRELNQRRPIAQITIEGHTDSLGDEARNLQLSTKRAQMVAASLKQQLDFKVPIVAVGLGETNPIADNGNFQGRAQNNRVEIRVQYRRASQK